MKNEFVLAPAEEMIPFAGEELAIVRGFDLTLFDREYFIAVECLCGARFYSETVNWETVQEYKQVYAAMCSYFGGGVLTVYEYCGAYGLDVVSDEVVW